MKGPREYVGGPLDGDWEPDSQLRGESPITSLLNLNIHPSVKKSKGTIGLYAPAYRNGEEVLEWQGDIGTVGPS